MDVSVLQKKKQKKKHFYMCHFNDLDSFMLKPEEVDTSLEKKNR